MSGIYEIDIMLQDCENQAILETYKVIILTSYTEHALERDRKFGRYWLILRNVSVFSDTRTRQHQLLLMKPQQ